jgi:hypothetical protein
MGIFLGPAKIEQVLPEFDEEGHGVVSIDGLLRRLRRVSSERGSLGSKASLSLGADIHLNVLTNSYDRMYLWACSVEMGT